MSVSLTFVFVATSTIQKPEAEEGALPIQNGQNNYSYIIISLAEFCEGKLEKI